MADGTDCDVSSNGEVFDDVDQDPNAILQNVEKTCIKIMVPSMAESSMSKMRSPTNDGSDDHDVKFVHLGAGDDDSPHDGDDGDRKHFVGGARAVKWTLETMAAAMDSVLAGELTTTNASRQFGIPRTTLLDRLAMKVKRQQLEQPGSYPLSLENTQKVIDFYHQNENLDKPSLLRGILKLAEDLAIDQGTQFESPLHTRKWLKLFVQKHPDLNILQYNRARARSSSSFGSRGSVTMAPLIASPKPHHSDTPAGAHLIHLQMPADLGPFAHQVAQVVTTGHVHQNQAAVHEVMPQQQQPQHGTGHSLQQPTAIVIQEETSQQTQTFDSFESVLARQGLEAVERKLSSEQRSYFNYRFHNSNLDKGFELWKLCKCKSESFTDVDSFECMLAAQALLGIENNLVPEYLKYFKFRYENPSLEEGYKLWSMLKAKTKTT